MNHSSAVYWHGGSIQCLVPVLSAGLASWNGILYIFISGT